MKKNVWSMRIYTNPGIIGWDLGPHFHFLNGDSEEITLKPIFESHHVDVLKPQESTRAYIRFNALMRLVNGLRIINKADMIKLDTSLFFDNGISIQSVNYGTDLDILLEELENPFDKDMLAKLEKRDVSSPPSRLKDYTQLIIDEPIVREVIILLTLSHEQAIYLLINTYKIFENINTDLDLKTSKYVNPGHLPEDLFDSLTKLKEYTQYINSRNGSGILSRHGATNIPAPAHKPTLNQIKELLVSVVDEWMNYKCTIAFKRKYTRK